MIDWRQVLLEGLTQLAILVTGAAAALGTWAKLRTSGNVTREAEAKADEAEATQVAAIMELLKERLAAVDQRLAECELRCRNCEKDHDASRTREAELMARVTALEAQLAAALRGTL